MFSQLVATCNICTVNPRCQLLPHVRLQNCRFTVSAYTFKGQQPQGRLFRLRDVKCVRAVVPKAALEDAKVDLVVDSVPGGERTKLGGRIFDFLFVFGGLLDRPFGDGESIAAAGGVVVEQAKNDAEELMSKGAVDKQVCFELLRALQLVSMDLKLVAAARKEATLIERLEATKVNLKLAMRMADLL